MSWDYSAYRRIYYIWDSLEDLDYRIRKGKKTGGEIDDLRKWTERGETLLTEPGGSADRRTALEISVGAGRGVLDGDVTAARVLWVRDHPEEAAQQADAQLKRELMEKAEQSVGARTFRQVAEQLRDAVTRFVHGSQAQRRNELNIIRGILERDDVKDWIYAELPPQGIYQIQWGPFLNDVKRARLWIKSDDASRGVETRAGEIAASRSSRATAVSQRITAGARAEILRLQSIRDLYHVGITPPPGEGNWPLWATAGLLAAGAATGAYLIWSK